MKILTHLVSIVLALGFTLATDCQTKPRKTRTPHCLN